MHSLERTTGKMAACGRPGLRYDLFDAFSQLSTKEATTLGQLSSAPRVLILEQR